MVKVLKVLKATKKAGLIHLLLVIPIIHQLGNYEEDDKGVKTMKHQLLASVTHYFKDIGSMKHFVLATILNPKYKL